MLEEIAPIDIAVLELLCHTVKLLAHSALVTGLESHVRLADDLIPVRELTILKYV